MTYSVKSRCRSSLSRLQNFHGHDYRWHVDCQCHVCCVCGTAEHRNGTFLYVGKYSKTEPPCEGNHLGRLNWLAQAKDG